MDSVRTAMILLQDGDDALPFKPEEYEVHPVDTIGMSFDAVYESIMEKGVAAVLVDVPEMAADAIDLCRKLRSEPDLDGLPLIALLRLPTRAIVNAVIEAGVDQAILLPTTERAIAERLGGLIPDRISAGAAMTESASS